MDTVNHSPLRYPGGKAKIAPLVKLIVKNLLFSEVTYIEPFAGGAGIALDLLLEGVAERVIINDSDKAIYSFWRTLKEKPQALVKFIQDVPLTVEEWHKQRQIYLTQNARYSVELGLSAFYLNRTNRSGILSAGPIGGYEQKGEYKIGARFNRESLIDRVQNIAAHRKRISVFNKDIRSFLRVVMPQYGEKSFAYFDPPYYINGQRLYKNALSASDHAIIARIISEKVKCPWIITYDSVPKLEELYSLYPQKHYSLNYSAANKGKGIELIIFKSEHLIPTEESIRNCMKNFQLV